MKNCAPIKSKVSIPPPIIAKTSAVGGLVGAASRAPNKKQGYHPADTLSQKKQASCPLPFYSFYRGGETQRLLSLPTAQSNHLYYHRTESSLTFPSPIERCFLIHVFVIFFHIPLRQTLQFRQKIAYIFAKDCIYLCRKSCRFSTKTDTILETIDCQQVAEPNILPWKAVQARHTVRLFHSLKYCEECRTQCKLSRCCVPIITKNKRSQKA